MDMGYPLLIFIIACIALAILWGAYGVSPLMLLRLVFVNNNTPAVMSREGDEVSAHAASSLQTRQQTASDQTEDPKARRAKLLDTYKALRKLGMSRDDARALLKPWGIPLDNNLWADAAPPQEEPLEVTPIAGRPTSAKFHQDDPELEYRPLRS